MNVVNQQLISPVPSDPNNVAETFANGPISAQGIGSILTLTFTSIRPSKMDMTSTTAPQMTAVVVSRIALPLEVVVQLKHLLNSSVLEQIRPTAQAPTLKQ